MAQGPESLFWQSLRKKLPKKTHATRIENRHGAGVPDVHIAQDGVSYWVELKVAKSNKVLITADQVAWHAAYTRCGGRSFILVKRSKDRCLFLFEGGSGSAVREAGLAAQCAWSGSDPAALFAFLRFAAQQPQSPVRKEKNPNPAACGPAS